MLIETVAKQPFSFQVVPFDSPRNQITIHVRIYSHTFISLSSKYRQVLFADRTATQYGRLLASSCRPSVRLSVRLSVTLCIVALRVSVHGQKLHQRVLSRQVPICPFRHFCCGMYLLVTKKRIEENAHASFLRQTIRHALVMLCSVI